MIDILIIAILAVIVGGAALYIRKARKNGTKCIGCPQARNCSGNCGSCHCNCGHE